MTDREARLMLSPDDVPLIQMLLADNGGTVVNAETWNVVKKSLPILFNQRAVLTAEVERMRTVVDAAVQWRVIDEVDDPRPVDYQSSWVAAVRALKEAIDAYRFQED